MRRLGINVAAMLLGLLILYALVWIVAGAAAIAGVAWGGYRVGRFIESRRARRLKAPASRTVIPTC